MPMVFADLARLVRVAQLTFFFKLQVGCFRKTCVERKFQLASGERLV